MEMFSFYHGAISKETGERLLSANGKDGSYLIRNSETVPGVYCLCVLCKDCVFTYRMHKDDQEFWTVETAPGVRKRLYRNVRNLISAFEKENQGIAIPLRYPVSSENSYTSQPTKPHNQRR